MTYLLKICPFRPCLDLTYDALLPLNTSPTDRYADALALRSRALDGLGRAQRELGVYDQSLMLHSVAARVARELTASPLAASTRVRPAPAVLVANAVSNAGVTAYRQVG